MRRFAHVVALMLAAGFLFSEETAKPDPLLALPQLAKAKVQPAEPLGDLATLAPGILAAKSAVVLEGKILLDQGPVDGLEVLACLDGGKTHESAIKLVTNNGQLVKFAFMSVLKVSDGVPAQEQSKTPARGTPLRVQVQWQSPEDQSKWLAIDASTFTRDRILDRPYPPLPFVYTGSRLVSIDEAGPDGKTVARERFMLDMTKSVITNFNEPDALLQSPYPGADEDDRFEINSGVCPHAGTAVRLVFSRVDLPLTLNMDANGLLSERLVGAAELADQDLIGLLAKHYGEGTSPNQRAVAIQVPAGLVEEVVEKSRDRLLGLAAKAKAWVIPVFVVAEAGK